MPSILLSVPDLSCGHCVATVKEALQDIPGLEALHVDLPGKQARFELSEPSQLPEILRRLDAEGYPATPVS